VSEREREREREREMSLASACMDGYILFILGIKHLIHLPAPKTQNGDFLEDGSNDCD
jgi:hypothetical protein